MNKLNQFFGLTIPLFDFLSIFIIIPDGILEVFVFLYELLFGVNF